MYQRGSAAAGIGLRFQQSKAQLSLRSGRQKVEVPPCAATHNDERLGDKQTWDLLSSSDSLLDDY
jgi:hypothetical protein